jgi:hypothetical protein
MQKRIRRGKFVANVHIKQNDNVLKTKHNSKLFILPNIVSAPSPIKIRPMAEDPL